MAVAQEIELVNACTCNKDTGEIVFDCEQWTCSNSKNYDAERKRESNRRQDEDRREAERRREEKESSATK